MQRITAVITCRLENLAHEAGRTPNGHGKRATPDYETCHDRFPHLNPLPQAGEEANESLRELHVNDVLKHVLRDGFDAIEYTIKAVKARMLDSLIERHVRNEKFGRLG